MGMLDPLYKLMGWIVEGIYNLVQNYGVSIILFTIVIKILVLPLNIKSQKAMKKQQKIQPVIAELQKKYANDKQKLQQEMMKIYKDNNISMAGGCLPMLIQFPILICLYQIIRRPLEYLKGVNWSSAKGLIEKYDLMTAIGQTGKLTENIWKNYQISFAKAAEGISQLKDWVINFNFLGFDMSKYPQEALSLIMKGQFKEWRTILIILIPVLAAFFTWLSTKVTQIESGQNKQDSESQAAQMSKSMTLMMPLMTLFFAFSLPAGMGLYWIVSSAVQIIQQVILNRVLKDEGDVIIVKDYSTKKRKKRR